MSAVTYQENPERTEFAIWRCNGLSATGEYIELTGGRWQYWTSFSQQDSSGVSHTTAITPEVAAATVAAWQKEAQAQT